MTARVFISYRTNDGADKATALARDLEARFGSDQVFLDKEDLPAGSRWRDAISSALHECPILLVLVTPDYLGALDSEGKRCIERDDDPARDELTAAIAAKAHIVPLLCDGVTALPAAADLPEPFKLLGDLQWGRLRAFDWREDLERLADDLQRLGVSPAAAVADAAAAQPTTTPMPLDESGPSLPARTAPPADRRLALVFGALAMLGVGGWGVWRWRRHRRADLSGRWSARIGARGAPGAAGGAIVVMTLEQTDRQLTLTSSAVNVEGDPDWQNYRDYWQQRTGTELRRVFYHGEGKILDDDEDEEEQARGDAAASAVGRAPRPPDAVVAHHVVMAIHIVAPGGANDPIDNGALRGSLDADDRRIEGRLWLNSEQAERVVELRRSR